METEASGLRINPYELLVQNPDSTFFLQAGNDNSEFGISAGDYIIVDREVPALDGKLVIATLEDGLRIMKLRRNSEAFLEAGGNH